MLFCLQVLAKGDKLVDADVSKQMAALLKQMQASGLLAGGFFLCKGVVLSQSGCGGQWWREKRMAAMLQQMQVQGCKPAVTPAVACWAGCTTAAVLALNWDDCRGASHHALPTTCAWNASYREW